MSFAKKGLGKGLGALISSTETEGRFDESPNNKGVVEMDINKVEPNKNQPRKYFDDDSLHELAESLTQYGIISPIIVKQEDDYYSIIAGERRWRAARIAKFKTVPVIIKDYGESEILEIALIENLQRQDLNPIEEAMCYKRLVSEFFFTQESIAEKIGKSRNSVSYAIRLLNLDERVQGLIMEGKISAAHGHCLLQAKSPQDQFELAEHFIEAGASVREAEKMVKAFYESLDTAKKAAAPLKKDAAFASVEMDLQHILGTKVNIKNGQNKGRIEIEYYSAEELDRLLGMFKKIDA